MNNEHMYSCIDDLEVALGDGDLKDFAPQPHFAPQPYFPSVQMAPPQRAPPELLPQRAPPATTSYAYGEHSYELVPSREQLGPLRPSNNTMHGLEEHAAANVLVRHLVKTHKEMFKAQTQVLTKMSNKLEGFDNRLTRYEARLKRLELLEQKRQQTPLNGEASARAPPIPNQTSAALAPIPASASLSMPAPIQAPPLMPAPDPIASSARASGAREPPGWSKLNVQARELVRRVASDRLANVYRGALGTLTSHAALSLLLPALTFHACCLLLVL